MPRLALALLALACVATVASPAHARPAPRIESLSWSEGYPGAIIRIRGTGFTDRIADCDALFGDLRGPVLEAPPEELLVYVPAELKPGDVKLAVTIAGARSNEVSFKVLDPRKIREPPFPRFSGPPLHRGPRRPDRLRLLGPKQPDGYVIASLIESHGSVRIEVKGESKLPDDYFIRIDLQGPGTPAYLCDDEVTVRGGTFEATLRPAALAPGRYVVEATFDVTLQPLDLQYRFEREVKDPGYRRLFDRATVVVPEPR